MDRAERKRSDLLFYCMQSQSQVSVLSQGKETETLPSSAVAQPLAKSDESLTRAWCFREAAVFLRCS